VRVFKKVMVDLNRGRRDEARGIKKFQKKFILKKKKLRRGGASANHRAGAPPASSHSSSPVAYQKREGRASLSSFLFCLVLERGREEEMKVQNRIPSFYSLSEPVWFTKPDRSSFSWFPSSSFNL